MAEKKTYYLVDFENVGEPAIVNSKSLPSTSVVHLFSTKAAAKISTATLSTINLSNLKIHEVPQGDQSLDMHLVSYLGYLIGKSGKASDYVIVSKDTDYDKIIKYWRREAGVIVRRQPAIRQVQKAEVPQKQTKAIVKAGEQTSGSAATKLNSTVQRALSKAGFDNSTIGKAASVVVKGKATGAGKQQVYQALVSKFGNENGQSVYRCIREHL